MKAKRAFLIEPKKFKIDYVDVEPKSNQVLVKVVSCGLCNWELNHWHGRLGTFPQSLGHEWAGIVVDVGSDVKTLKPGDKVTALPDDLSGFSEYTVVDEKNCVKLSDNINLKYALGEPLKCIVTVLRSARPEAGDYGVIVGCGFMGLLCIQALKGNTLSELIAVDIDENKLDMALEFGATKTINAEKENVVEKIQDITKGHMADFVIEGTGNPNVLNVCQRYLRTSRGRLVLMSSHETECEKFDFREAIKRSIEIIVAHPSYSLNPLDDLRRAVNLLEKGTFNIERLVTHEFSLENIQEAFETLENKPKGYIKGLVVNDI